MIQEQIEATIEVTRADGGFYLCSQIGSGKTSSGTEFKILAALNGATIVRIGDVSYILDLDSFIRFAIDEEAKR